ncbi:hypothetical protein FRB93_001224 [Tulasnella sp. JGI-2019a]|nr:hypothetical protein FRB93_001224 [Tulasnella sp. JGI-2019a]
MSSTRLESSSAKGKHRLLGLPERARRGLACKACRKKKHLCDRIKPSCTACSKGRIECIYLDRRPHKTVAELKDLLRDFERKYSRLEATHKKRASKPKPDAFAVTGDEATGRVEELDSLLLFYRSKLSAPQTEVPYGGYHFDESFLTISPLNSKTSPPATDTSPSACSIRCSIPHPTRIFSCVPRYPPGPLIHQSNLRGTSLELEPPLLEKETPEFQSLASTQDPLSNRVSVSSEVWNQCRLNTNDGWPSSQLTYNPLHKIPQGQTPLPPPIEIIRPPTLHFSRASWWDHLTRTYTLRPTNTSVTVSISRHDAVSEISRDVYGFFKFAPAWASFINTSLFFDTFHHTELRSAIQPSLVLSILAYSKLVQLDEETRKKDPRTHERSWRQSVALRDLAQASFEASYNAGWIDVPLAQAAWILVLYENSPHPNSVPYRRQSAISLLDNVICALGLTSLDATNPHAAMFAPNVVPALGRPPSSCAKHQAATFISSSVMDYPPTPSPTSLSSRGALARYQATILQTPFDNPVDQPQSQNNHGLDDITTCPCQSLSLSRSPDVLRFTPLWDAMPRWVPNATWAEIRKEEGRRLVWSSLGMLGMDTAARQASAMPQQDLHVTKQENFALLFPGEEDHTSLPNEDTAHSGKESHWALWGRTMLLWFACIRRESCRRLRTKVSVSPSATGEETMYGTDEEFAMQVWMETDAIEDALNNHTCLTEKALMYHQREFLFIIRMQVSRGFRRSIPMAQTDVNVIRLDRDSALNWIRHRYRMGTTMSGIITGDAESPGRKMLLKLPFMVYYSLVIEWRAIELWKLDNSLLLAIDVALKYRRIVDWFRQLWPCAETEKWAATISGELKSICRILGKDVE